MNTTTHSAALLLALLIGCVAVQNTYAGSTAQLASQAVAKKLLARDLARDAITTAKALPASRTVQRFTTLQQAKREARFGLPPGTHMTPGLRRGRPLSGEGAARRYGLLRQPTARETIVLPKGTPLRVNKALGGKAGVGELTSPRRVPSAAIVRIDKVPSGKRGLRVNAGPQTASNSTHGKGTPQ